MAQDQSIDRGELLALTAEIVAAHVGNNAIAGTDLGGLIQSVFDTQRGLASDEPAVSTEGEHRQSAIRPTAGRELGRSLLPAADGSASGKTRRIHQCYFSHAGRIGRQVEVGAGSWRLGQVPTPGA